MILNISKALILLSLLPAFAQADTKTEPGKYQIDPMHSKVGFEVSHLVISSVEGTFRTFDGVIDLDPDFVKSKVTANVEIASIDTGVPKRDDHLKSPDFFDAKKFPKMIFQSTSIKGNQSAFDMVGDLSLHGVTKRVTFKAKYLGAVTDGFGNRKVAFNAEAKINRKDFGLNWNKAVEAGPVVGDDVTISLKIQAAKVTSK